jgi:hypothetical protein
MASQTDDTENEIYSAVIWPRSRRAASRKRVSEAISILQTKGRYEELRREADKKEFGTVEVGYMWSAWNYIKQLFYGKDDNNKVIYYPAI